MTGGGMISLSPLYDFVHENKDNCREAMTLFRSTLGSNYSKLCQQVTEPIDPTSGFYVWGYYDRHLYWHSTYLGKAGFRQHGTNLRKRILEELKDERGFVWRAAFDEATIRKMADEIHHGKYKWDRPLLKAGSTRIMWFPVLDLQNSDILQVESDLIEALNPGANRMRPTPANAVPQIAEKALLRFRQMIHENRPSAAANDHKTLCQRLNNVWKDNEGRAC